MAGAGGELTVKSSFRSYLCAALGAVVLSAPAAAATNLGFETGDVSGWTVGLNPSVGAVSGYGPFSPVSGGFLGFAEAGAQDVYTTLTQVFTLAAGDKLSGNFGFRANDVYADGNDIYNDDGYLSVDGTNLLTFDVLAVGDYGSSGWVPFTFTAPTAGNYVLEIGAVNRFDSNFASGVVLDAVSVTAVPEPASWTLILAGFATAGAALRRQRLGVVNA